MADGVSGPSTEDVPRRPGPPDDGGTGEAERAARALLTRILEPGDEKGGRWLRIYGPDVVVGRLMADRPLPGVTPRRWAGLMGRVSRVLPAHERDAALWAPGVRAADRGVDGGPGDRSGRLAGEGAPAGTGPGDNNGPGDDASRGGRLGRTGTGTGTGAAPARPLRAVPRTPGAAGGIRFVCPGDAEWPAQLDDLGDARPIGLWLRGPASLRMWALRSVALVGSRACSEYGSHTAALLAAQLTERGWVVVSGAAYGIDGAAHRGALGSGGATVAVLACGVDRSYPQGHARLIARIAEQGVLASELPPGDHPTPSRFVLRNRVIAALTRGTVVVEAAYRSGALATARSARRLGRHTMGVPGPVTSGRSAGVHELIRSGATLVTDADDVIEMVGDMGELAPRRHGPLVPHDLLDPDTARILAVLPARAPARLADIAGAAGAVPDEALARLYELHALGFVERHGDDWQLTRQEVAPWWRSGPGS